MSKGRGILSFKQFRETHLKNEQEYSASEKMSEVSSRQKRLRELIRKVVHQRMKKIGLI